MQAVAARDALALADVVLLEQTAVSTALLTDQASDLATQFMRFKLPQPAWHAAFSHHT